MVRWWRRWNIGSLEWEWGKRGWLMAGWDGWLMNREAGCQCKPVIEGGCELPPWIYNVPWLLQHSTGCLQGASSSHNLLLHTGLLYVSVSCFKQKCIVYGSKYEKNGQFTYVIYISSVNNVWVKQTFREFDFKSLFCYEIKKKKFSSFSISIRIAEWRVGKV